MNPFYKYLTPEDKLHIAIKELLSVYGLRFIHSPDEGKRSPFERYKYSVLSGNIKKPPDFICITPRNGYTGLALEAKTNCPFKKDGSLKADKTGRLQGQAETLEEFRGVGYYASFVWNIDMAIDIVTKYTGQ